MRNIFFSLLVLLVIPVLAKSPVFTAEDMSNPPPKVIRICCAFGVDLSIARIPFVKKTDIIALNELGPHKYLGHKSENNGIIYTKKGGFLDLGHLRDYADWTAYLYNLITRLAEEGGGSAHLELGIEAGPKTLTINIPKENNSLDYFELAGRIAYDLSLWHEIATWYGASFIPLIPEKFSSFSPEDLYSNLLGVRIGIEAIKSDLEYDEAMTQLLSETLISLEAVDTYEATYNAMEEVESVWWDSNKALPNERLLLKRYMNYEEYLVPWILPEDLLDKTRKLIKPDKELRSYYQLQIDLNNKIPIEIIRPDNTSRTVSQNDFDLLINAIIKDQLDEKTSGPNKEKPNKKIKQ